MYTLHLHKSEKMARKLHPSEMVQQVVVIIVGREVRVSERQFAKHRTDVEASIFVITDTHLRSKIARPLSLSF